MTAALEFSRCAPCARWFALPLERCPACAGATPLARVAPFGRVVSWTVVEHQTHPDLPVPYTILLIELDAGVRTIGSLPGAPDVTDGAPVRANLSAAGVSWELAR